MFVWWALRPFVFTFCPKLMKTEGVFSPRTATPAERFSCKNWSAAKDDDELNCKSTEQEC